MLHFPSWRYHATDKPRVVHTPEEAAALGPAWCQSEPEALAYAEAQKQAAENAPPATLDGISVAKAEPLIAAADGPQIAAWLEAELAGDARKSMVNALEARGQALIAASES